MGVPRAIVRGGHVRIGGGMAGGEHRGAVAEVEGESAEDRHEDEGGTGGSVGGVALVDGEVGGFGVEAKLGSGGGGGDGEGVVVVGDVEVGDHAADEGHLEEGVDGEESEEGGEEKAWEGGHGGGGVCW